MAPQVTSWKDLAHLSEEFDPETGEFQHTLFAAIADDTVYIGQLNVRQLEISFPQLMSALSPIPDEVIFPEYSSSDMILTRAPEMLPANVYIKRPKLSMYDIYKEHNVLHLLGQVLMQEAQTIQVLSQHPHPNIVRYHGCWVRRGRVTGLVLD